ncbi:hypothetical protein Hypma_006148 [Hypsizygus marmoreus]|uniref:Uncharacterized protein n=1 Tax=Hypsizygus marmoreus TaxID=39966 RepID=A0A369JTH6_HYPMA|nr:hypothetical protein Hypma_006148 [Hypsizygus marmoreus]
MTYLRGMPVHSPALPLPRRLASTVAHVDDRNDCPTSALFGIGGCDQPINDASSSIPGMQVHALTCKECHGSHTPDYFSPAGPNPL